MLKSNNEKCLYSPLKLLFWIGSLFCAAENLFSLILVDEKQEIIAPSLPFPITTSAARRSFSSFRPTKWGPPERCVSFASSGASFRPRKSRRLPCTAWESSPRTRLWPSPGFGTSSGSCGSSRRPLARSSLSRKSRRGSLWRSRILASGSGNDGYSNVFGIDNRVLLGSWNTLPQHNDAWSVCR